MGRPRIIKEINIPGDNDDETKTVSEENPQVVEPADISGSDESVSEAIKRPRKKRGPNKSKTSDGNNQTVVVLANALVMVSTIMAQKFKIPELGLNQYEAKEIDKAVSSLLDYYHIGWLSDEAKLWVNLVTTVGVCASVHYGVYKERMSNQKFITQDHTDKLAG